MSRVRQVSFAVSVCLTCWLGMMAVHELGHVVAAVSSGGRVLQVVLHPLTISRTDVSPNPHPLFVCWSGPAVGALLPLLAWGLSRRFARIQPYAQFFAGFCLITNGIYLAAGSLRRIGDADLILKFGTPLWAVMTVGTLATSLGVLLWHGLPSLSDFLTHPQRVRGRAAVISMVVAATFAAFCSFFGG